MRLPRENHFLFKMNDARDIFSSFIYMNIHMYGAYNQMSQIESQCQIGTTKVES